MTSQIFFLVFLVFLYFIFYIFFFVVLVVCFILALWMIEVLKFYCYTPQLVSQSVIPASQPLLVKQIKIKKLSMKAGNQNEKLTKTTAKKVYKQFLEPLIGFLRLDWVLNAARFSKKRQYCKVCHEHTHSHTHTRTHSDPCTQAKSTIKLIL